MSRHLVAVGVLGGLLLASSSISYAASNLNLSKSNINRLVHPPTVKPTVATAIVMDLDKMLPTANEATVQEIVRKHLGTVKSSSGHDLIIRVRPVPGSQKGWAVLIMEDAADESEAARIAGTGPAGPHNLRPGYDLKSNKASPKQ